MQIHTLGIDLGKTVFHVVGLNAAVYPHALRHCFATLLFGNPLINPESGKLALFGQNRNRKSTWISHLQRPQSPTHLAAAPNDSR
jgi:hypothetical protein